MQNSHSTAFVLISIIVVLVISVTACGTDEPARNSSDSSSAAGSQPLDPATATLDQILERTRAAMGAITSYKIRGVAVTEISIDSDLVRSLQADEFREWQAPDRFYTRSETAGSGFRDARLNETIFIADQVYSRSARIDWQQVESFSPSRWQQLAFSAHVIILDAPDMRLVSSNEETDDGTKVYRLEFSESPFLPFYEEDLAESEGPQPLDQPRIPEIVSKSLTTLLIDQQTFRILIQITDGTREVIPGDQNSVATGTENAVLSFSTGEKKHSVQTIHYYDYNIPNVIEPPAEYIKAGEANSLGTGLNVIQSAQNDLDQPAPSLPANIYTQSCSEPGVSWPDCAVQTTAEFEAMLSIFPDDHKIKIDENIVITLAFNGPPDIDWPADGFIWHAPSGLFLFMCISDSIEPEFRFWVTSPTSRQMAFPEAVPLLNQVLADDTVANLIRGRTYEVKGSCE